MSAFSKALIWVVYDYAKILNLKQFTTASDIRWTGAELSMTMQRY